MTAIALSSCPHTTLSYLFEKKLVAPQATQNIFCLSLFVGFPPIPSPPLFHRTLSALADSGVSS